MSYPPIIKICGIKTPDMLEATIAAGADMVGFVHFPRSPRHVDIDPLAELISLARGRIETCVLLVNPDNSKVTEIAALDPDWIQLHGPEDAAPGRSHPRRGRHRHPQGGRHRQRQRPRPDRRL